MIPQSFIQELLGRVDIVDVIDMSVHRTQPAIAPPARTVNIAAAPSFADTSPIPHGTVLE